MPVVDEEDYLAHYGILRKSGRYPWGSGGSFLSEVERLKREGLTETEIARGFGVTTTQLRAAKTIARNKQKQEQINQAQRLKDKGYSNVAIGERMGLNESSVRALLAPGAREKIDILESTADMLKAQVDKKGIIDIGSGVETSLPLSDNPAASIGISKTKFDTAVAKLQREGYRVQYVKVDQLGTGKQTTIKVLTRDDMSYSDVFRNRDRIQSITDYSDDGGRSYRNRVGLQRPISVSSRRIGVRYAEDGGAAEDGVIYVRPGARDLSLGRARYAQVRIAVDGTHYLKGMAVYKDDLPNGVDLVFNTNKRNTGNKKDAFKKMSDDPDNPFGSMVRQLTDSRGRVNSAMNIVNEEGDWDRWSRSLSSQMLSKQSPRLARTQLDMTYDRKSRELDEIMSLTNPTVRKKLLESFADDADAAAVHLRAAAPFNTAQRVILPINSLKRNEIYSPSHRDGERVVLIRHPHGGTFEIPELTVNNRNRQARSIIGTGKRDAVGIHSDVAERLSGADFDGDTVLVIPNNQGKIKTSPALAGLRGFDPRSAYPAYEGMTPISPRRKQMEMGLVTNLIADMTIKGASSDELARAVRHSMVVIDAEKHNLDYKGSAAANGIAALKQKYQGGANRGASTLITKATARTRIPERKPRSAARGGPIDRETGRRVYEETGGTYRNRAGRIVRREVTIKRLALADDAHTLSSGTPIERVYADHSNRLKSLANQARKAAVSTRSIPYSPSAKKTYSREVASLDAKLNLALKNAPLERQAQVIANGVVSAKRRANPDMDSADLKKIRNQALTEARLRTGARKQRIVVTQGEWDAIQAGAISNDRLSRILNNADLDVIRRLATPRVNRVMTGPKQARARAMLAAGYNLAEIADALGVPRSTLASSIGE